MSDGKVQAALVAALVTLSVALLGEMFLRLRERRVRRESATAVYRKYADPLAAASTALFYRLHEIFDERGGVSTCRTMNMSFDTNTTRRSARCTGWQPSSAGSKA